MKAVVPQSFSPTTTCQYPLVAFNVDSTVGGINAFVHTRYGIRISFYESVKSSAVNIES